LLLVVEVVVEHTVEVVVLVGIAHHLLILFREPTHCLLALVAQQNRMVLIQEFLTYLHQCGLQVVVLAELLFHMNQAQLVIMAPAVVQVAEDVVETITHSQQE
jgi:hypothetical protein